VRVIIFSRSHFRSYCILYMYIYIYTYIYIYIYIYLYTNNQRGTVHDHRATFRAENHAITVAVPARSDSEMRFTYEGDFPRG